MWFCWFFVLFCFVLTSAWKNQLPSFICHPTGNLELDFACTVADPLESTTETPQGRPCPRVRRVRLVLAARFSPVRWTHSLTPPVLEALGRPKIDMRMIHWPNMFANLDEANSRPEPSCAIAMTCPDWVCFRPIEMGWLGPSSVTSMYLKLISCVRLSKMRNRCKSTYSIPRIFLRLTIPLESKKVQPL